MTERRTVVQAGGRAKAYRPIPIDARREAFKAGLEAYERGEFFEAHELLEPAWMGTDDLGERAFLQGLIKLAAGLVHATRGNPLGVAKNLAGARSHLRVTGAADWGRRYGVDVEELLRGMDVVLGSNDPQRRQIRIPRLPEGDAGS